MLENTQFTLDAHVYSVVVMEPAHCAISSQGVTNHCCGGNKVTSACTRHQYKYWEIAWNKSSSDLLRKWWRKYHETVTSPTTSDQSYVSTSNRLFIRGETWKAQWRSTLSTLNALLSAIRLYSIMINHSSHPELRGTASRLKDFKGAGCNRPWSPLD